MAELIAFLISAPAVFKITTSAGAKYRKARFGSVWGSLFYSLRLIDTDALQQRHWDINIWTDEEVNNWKAAHLASCNAIAVAGAIFASIGLTALQLPRMNAVHWSARACCVASMILGVVSVTTATKQHQAIGALKSALDVRLWMSRGEPTLYGAFCGTKKINKIRERWYQKAQGKLVRHPRFMEALDLYPRKDLESDTGLESAPKAPTRSLTFKYADNEDFQDLPLESSISNLKSVALPRHLLDMAVILFLTGMGLYELFCWKADAKLSDRSCRNVFIVFIATLGAYIIYDVSISFARILNNEKRNREFDTTTLGGFRGLGKTQQLENNLTSARERVGLATRLEDLVAQHRELDRLLNVSKARLDRRASQDPAVKLGVSSSDWQPSALNDKKLHGPGDAEQTPKQATANPFP